MGNGSTLRCTVLLGITASGLKLPPLLVFKGTATGRVRREFVNYNPGARYATQEKAWVDQAVMQRWIETVWTPWTAMHPRSYLLMDQFTVHKTAETTNAIQARGTRIDYILEGCTSKLQPLDVGINKPFKDRMRAICEEFAADNEPGTKPSRDKIADWVVEAWEGITPVMITNTWRHIGYIQ